LADQLPKIVDDDVSFWQISRQIHTDPYLKYSIDTYRYSAYYVIVIHREELDFGFTRSPTKNKEAPTKE
jgi:hypothetical protein